ncbi:MAG: phenylalanine--tRNA ligase subunit beta [Candidatus Symbiothrix sp.]|jgi:phenylalanyl-tRNA synthetase beta chain|nr:phenylalanine--tRNA ligase subunit beta [Candidatus Symbiothrix sp.]
MNISYNWLKDYISLDLSPEQTAAALTAIGLETGSISEVESVKGGLKGVVVGKVLTCIDHPNSDHLHITTVDLGDGIPQQIVCGAPNVAAGQTVVVATVGTTLYSGDESFVIKKSKIRGEESNGMICAEDELGIGNSHDGIIVLPDEVKVGTPAAEYYRLESDFVLEVDITPNRIDAASHYGVARDLAAYLAVNQTDPSLHRPSVETFRIEDPSPAVTVSVENTEACPRYSGVTIRNITVKESPDWLKKRLEAIGLRAINNVVDVTNYVLHETGQPLHAFDLRQIKGGKIIVKTLPADTPFVTLDGIERRLSDKDLMICNEEGGMCIGGVFGGLDSGVTETTTDVFLESACFHPTWIRKTARYHGLNTDASFRFERGADPNNTLYVLKRAALLVQEVAGGVITGNIQDVYPQPVSCPIVELKLQKVTDLIGKDIPTDTIEHILDRLEIRIVKKHADGWTLEIPTYRVDVTRDVDVIEDILRIYGYNQVEIDTTLQSTLSYQTAVDKSYALQNLISEQLTGAGFNEILNNSLTSATFYNDLTTFPATQCVKLRNPLSADLDVMRQTLLFGGLQSIAYNRNRKNTDLKFYEFGNTYTLTEPAGNSLDSIREQFALGLWLTGNTVDDSWIRPTEKTSIYELKAYIENIMARLGVKYKYKIPTATDSITLSDAISKSGGDAISKNGNDALSNALTIESMSGKKLGVFGVVSKQILKQFDIAADVFFAELSWDALLKEHRQTKVRQTAISKFPAVRRDLALLLDKHIPFADVEKIAFQTDRKVLKEVFLFDVYEGKNLPEGKKSYAVGFILQDEEQTLNDRQIENLMTRIQKTIEDKLGAILR